MKKIVRIALSFILCFSCIAFVGCGDKHKHSYSGWAVVTPANCEQTGVKERKCECGHTETKTIQALGHNFVGGVCTDCGDPE